MPESLKDIRSRVFAIGASAAILIFWLSGSYWLDALHQHADVRRVERLAPLDERMNVLARDLAAERTLTLGVVDVADGGRYVLLDDPTLDEARTRLDRIRARADTSLVEVTRSLERLRRRPDLLDHLQVMPDALTRALARLDDRGQALVRDRTRFDSTFGAEIERRTREDAQPGAESLAPRAVTASLRVHASSGQLVQELHQLLSGIRLEPYTLMPTLEGLRRTRAGLRDFSEAESARSALQGLAPSYESRGGVTAPLTRALNEAALRSRTVASRLSALAEERRIGPSLRDDLGSLVDDHERLLLAWFPIAPSFNAAPRNRALELDVQVGQMIDAELQASKAHAYRRLFIDSLLVLSCLWIVLASLRLLVHIRHAAQHDTLTGLPNRASLDEQLQQVSAWGRRDGTDTALLMIDIDDFESVNDRFGHDVGDALLKRLAGRLSVRLDTDRELVALGGDDFALLARKVESTESVMTLAARLHAVCNRPFDVDGAAIRITTSIGVSVTDEHARDGSALLQRAGTAMRQAKDAGKNRVQPFSRELADQSRARIELQAELRRAVERDQLELHYQPKVATADGQVHGVEALLRWRHPTQGLVSPARFVPLAEESGLIVPIGAWVLEEALRQTAGWRADERLDLEISVNVSAQQLVAAGFTDMVERVLTHSGLPADRVELEITESVGMLDLTLVIARLERLRALGIRIAIDDFGTDYSSLQYLEVLPVDTLKIDRAFVVKLDSSEQGRSLVKTIVLMARSFGLATVAEGVETAVQLEKVIEAGCDQVQGYFHSRPVRAEELPGVVADINGIVADEAVRRIA